VLIETHSAPALTRCYPHSFTFYVGNPFPRFVVNELRRASNEGTLRFLQCSPFHNFQKSHIEIELKRQFEWDNASRKAASRYDVELQADKIAERKILPALLFVQGDADEQFSMGPARRAFEALKQRYVARGEAGRIQFEVIHGLAHNFGPGSSATGSAQASTDLEIEQKTKHWFQRFLYRALAMFAAREITKLTHASIVDAAIRAMAERASGVT
jgi:hypothetical protein